MALKGAVRFNSQSLNKYSAVIFDLSGVLVDFGVHVPVIAINRAFNNQGIHIPEKNIRQNRCSYKSKWFSNVGAINGEQG